MNWTEGQPDCGRTAKEDHGLSDREIGIRDDRFVRSAAHILLDPGWIPGLNQMRCWKCRVMALADIAAAVTLLADDLPPAEREAFFARVKYLEDRRQNRKAEAKTMTQDLIGK